MKRFKRFSSWISLFLLGVALIVVYKTFDNLNGIWSFVGTILGILSPFVGGFVLAFLLYGPSHRLELLLQKASLSFVSKHSRALSVAIVYLVLVALLVLLLVFALPPVVMGIFDFIKMIPTYIENARSLLEEYSQPGGMLAGLELNDKWDALYQGLMSKISGITLEDLTSYLQGVISAASTIVNAFMSFIISIYMLLSRESLVRALRAVLGLFLSERAMDTLNSYIHRVVRIFYGYLYGQALDALIIGVILAIGMQIIGVPNGWLLGLMTGTMNMIPYFGAIIGGVFSVLITLLSGSLYQAIFVAIYVVVMQQIDGNILQPRIVGNSIGLKPIYVLLSITVFGGLMGFWGIFLGVPIMAVIQMLLKDLIRYRSQKRRMVRLAVEGEPAAAAAADVSEEVPDPTESGS